MPKTKKTITNEELFDRLSDLIDSVGKISINCPNAEPELLAQKIVTRMTKIKSMENWFKEVNSSEIAWSTAYKDLKLTTEQDALGEAAKLMTLMEIFKEEEEYEKCGIIRGRMDEVNKILRGQKKPKGK